MTVIVHISDTHFGTEVASVVAAIKQSIAEIHPDVIILSGDITQRGAQGPVRGGIVLFKRAARCRKARHSGQPRYSTVQRIPALSRSLPELCAGLRPPRGGVVE